MKTPTVALVALLAVPALIHAGGGEALTVVDLEYRGTTSFATGLRFAGGEVGGLSALTYDRRRGVYYALSDDRSQRAAARFYTLAIDVADGSLEDGDVRLLDVTHLTDKRGDTFPELALDPEGLVLVGRRRLFLSTEGDSSSDPPIDPMIGRFRRSGRQTSALRVPAKFLPDAAGTAGVRLNEGFESLTATPGGGTLFAATEGALAQDGPAADLGRPGLARILRYDLGRGRAPREYVYVVEPVAQAPEPVDGFRVNGLVELLALDRWGTLLALERSFSEGRGNTVVLFEISIAGAADVSPRTSLVAGGEKAAAAPVAKRRLVDFGDLELVPDNLEGMALGPPFADGRRPLIVVSDNNFNPAQSTQFVLLAVRLEERRTTAGLAFSR